MGTRGLPHSEDARAPPAPPLLPPGPGPVPGGSLPQDQYPHLQHDLDTDTIITLAGYKAETHKVKTSDDYILTLHRIVGSGPVVFMQHGLEDSSAAWVLAG